MGGYKRRGDAVSRYARMSGYWPKFLIDTPATVSFIMDDTLNQTAYFKPRLLCYDYDVFDDNYILRFDCN